MTVELTELEIGAILILIKRDDSLALCDYMEGKDMEKGGKFRETLIGLEEKLKLEP